MIIPLEVMNFYESQLSCLAVGYDGEILEFVSKELNHLVSILHVYAGGLIFLK